MVARYRTSLRPINRIKHVADSQTSIPINTNVPVIIAVAKDNPVLSVASECALGCKINAFFISVEVVASELDAGATPNFYWYLWKNPGANLTAPQPNSVGTSDNKKHVIHQEMVMINAVVNGTPRSVFKGVIVIPKGMRRMGPEDQWLMQHFIPSTGVTVNSCAQVHYKEFR